MKKTDALKMMLKGETVQDSGGFFFRYSKEKERFETKFNTTAKWKEEVFICSAMESPLTINKEVENEMEGQDNSRCERD